MATTKKYIRAGFGGVLDDHKRIPDDAENREALKWERAHQKKELKAYLKGSTRFQHGRVPAMPLGFSPKMYPVRELVREVKPQPAA